MNDSRSSATSRMAMAGRFLAAAGVIAGATAIHAAVVTQTQSFDLDSGNLTAFVTNNGGSSSTVSPGSTQDVLTFSSFNASLGVLTGVTVSFASDYTTLLKLDVTPNTTGGFIDFADYFASSMVTFRLLNIPTAGTPTASDSLLATCTPAGESSSGCANSDGASGIAFNQAATSLSPLATFIGPGTFDLTAVLGWNGLSLGPDNGTKVADNTTITGTLGASWDGSVTIAYTYDPASTTVPEPTSLYLVGFALAAVGWLRRRAN